MNRITLSLLVAFTFYGCVREKSSDNNTQEKNQAMEVTITKPVYGSIKQEAILSATTTYLKKTTVTSPIQAFIVKSDVQPGMRVHAGELLYNLESKEQHALGNKAISNAPISVMAAHDGIVLDVMQQTGCYVGEGSTLCIIADVRSLVFDINVPYELHKNVMQNRHCTLELPDGTHIATTIQQTMATMNTISQSEHVIARAHTPFLPEGMIVKAIFQLRQVTDKYCMTLPKEAVQSNETQTEFWVMTVDKDTRARKIPVEVVAHNATEIEIKSSVLTPQYTVVLMGSYGLEDGTKVKIMK